MKWIKRPIKTEQLPALRELLIKQVKQADPKVEGARCIFKYKDSIMFTIYTAFDFLDNYDTLIKQGEIAEFYLYQLIDEKSIS